MDGPRALVDTIVARLEPLEIEVHRTWWHAAVTGDAGAYDRLAELRDRIDDLFRDPTVHRGLDEARGAVDDPILARTVELLHLESLPRQVDPALGRRINELASDIERDFATYRPLLDGERRTTNDLDAILRHASDVGLRERAWEAHKRVGPLLADRLVELASLRNEAARAVGFDDYYALRLAVGEQDPDDLARFLDRVERLTAEPFAALKGQIDGRLGERYGIDPAELRPWHYADPFFQEAPDVFGADLDAVYAAVDIVDVAARFFDGIGLPVGDVLARSSLYEAEGKDPHAFATDIDRAGDVRILLNLRPNERWMGTTLHELGHAVYDLGIDRDLPWPLRRPAHTLTTEAIAMLFGRLSRDAGWLAAMGIVDEVRAEEIAAAAADELRATLLVVARWVPVMAGFERALYADPGRDLQRTWWDEVERHQRLARPPRPSAAADYAAKIHVVAAPVYYHNYLLGECFASQLGARIGSEVLGDGGGWVGRPEVGAWLDERVFRPGARVHYDELARRATGAPVGPDAFAAQLLGAAG